MHRKKRLTIARSLYRRIQIPKYGGFVPFLYCSVSLHPLLSYTALLLSRPSGALLSLPYFSWVSLIFCQSSLGVRKMLRTLYRIRGLSYYTELVSDPHPLDNLYNYTMTFI